MSPLEGESLGVISNWPPSLLASLQRWGTTQPKSPCLSALDNAGKPVYTLTYGTPSVSRTHKSAVCVCVSDVSKQHGPFLCLR